LVLEREAAVQALREMCRDFGDNDWPEDLHLADILDKHLAKHLHARKRKA
jgi:predicted secreted protein